MKALYQVDLDADEILYFLKKEFQIQTIYRKILYRKIIEKAAIEKQVQITPKEIQEEADRIRRENLLEKASDTLAWLDSHKISTDEWEESIIERLWEQKLAEHLFDKETEKLFAQNKRDYDRVVLYQIIVSSEKLAYELFYQLEEKEISFYQAAHLYDLDADRRYRCGYEGKIERLALIPEIAAAVFGHPYGEAIEPIKVEEVYHLLLVEEFIPAELTPEIKQKIQQQMFQQWLDSELTYMLHHDSAST